ncbi:MAG: cytochrome c3 family protein [Magnetococcales bacterium]|nr:cytochrome c3 family protein [Magnetococcales bacterium]
MNAIPLRLFFTSAVLFLFSILSPVSYADPPSDKACLRCHGMATLAYQDPTTGGVRNLAIDAKAMARSEHRKLSCRDCHGTGLDDFPHFQEAKRERLECLKCHEKSQAFPRERFEAINKSFERSIHYQAMPETFTCFSCHDPHDFRAISGQSGADLPGVVAQDNAACRRCHDSSEGIRNQTGRLFATLADTHAWLPETERHWGKVRCIECHTRGRYKQHHFIVGKNDAVRACEACHSRNSLLAAKLYRHRIRHEQRTAGFIHSIVMNDAYIIGMTRHPWLDWGGAVLVALTLAGVAGHGLARYLSARSTPHEHHH